MKGVGARHGALGHGQRIHWALLLASSAFGCGRSARTIAPDATVSMGTSCSPLDDANCSDGSAGGSVDASVEGGASSDAGTDEAAVQARCDAVPCVSGCCGPDKLCHGGVADEACGNAATVCVDCTALGLICGGGACTTLGGCGPGNCAGCCEGSLCADGGDDMACGVNGTTCKDCVTHLGGWCNRKGGICSFGPQ